MATDESPTGGRDTVRILLIIGCLIAAVAAATLTPAIAGSGLAGSPLDTALPGEQLPEGNGGEAVGLEQADSIAGGSESGLGALNPGERSGVGGEIGFDNGTFGSNDTEVHFVVESSDPAYWRTGAYDRYTGTGWEQTGEPAAYERPIEHEGYSDRQIDYEVTLERPAAALPTVWRPHAVSGVNGLQVTDAGAVRSEQRLEAGTTYSGVSHTAERDVQLLRTTGQSYPDGVARQYTQLPDDTPARVESFTAELTNDNDNPYDTAMTVQRWLRTNKSYSLQAGEQSDHMADTFMFEMEDGYCEYFATSMVVMLRSQDIPARYTVGYSTGQEVSENTYEVRGMNAHAWVEVYFEDIGWVKFDPTPGSDRLASQAAALEDDGIDERVVKEEGSPGETFEPANSTGGKLPADSPGGAGGETPEPPGDTPQGDTGDENGNDVESQDDSGPDGDNESEQNDGDGPDDGDGQNDDTQQDENPGDESGDQQEGNDGTSGDQDEEEDDDGTTGDPQEDDDGTSGDGKQDGNTDGTDDTRNDDGNSVSYTTELNRTAVPGATVEVTVTVDGEPAVGREVSFNGESVGRTDQEGTVAGTVPYDEQLRITVGSDSADRTAAIGTPPRQTGQVYDLSDVSSPALVAGAGIAAQEDTYPVETNATVTVSGETLPGETVVVTALVEDVAVPDATVTVDSEPVNQTNEEGRATITLPEQSGNVTIGVERSPVSGSTTVFLPELSLAVESALPLALPYTGATAEVAAGETAIVGASVTVDGEEVATTGPDGRATIRLPLARTATIKTTARGMSRETTVGGLIRNLAILLTGVTAFVIGAGVGLARRGYRPRELFAAVRTLPSKIVHAVQWLLVTAMTRGDVLVKRGLSRLQQTVTHFVAVARGQQSLGELVEDFRTWLGESLDKIRACAGIDTGASGGTAATDRSGADVTVREAWEQFLRYTSVQRAPHRTPGELARHAIEEDDLPPDAVKTMRDVFREVEYGSRSPSERIERVQRAIDSIERDRRHNEEGKS